MAFYTATGNPTPNSPGASTTIRAEFNLIQAGFTAVTASFAALPAAADLATIVNASTTGTSTFNVTTQTLGNNSTLAANTAFVQAALAGYAKTTSPTITGASLVNPTLSGTVTVPSVSAGATGAIPATVDYVNAVALGAATISGVKSQTINTDATTLTTPNAYPSIYNTAASGANLMILPDARTVPVGFSYEINSSNASNLMTNDGKYLGSANVPAGLSRVWCLNNSTQAGTWAVTPAVTLSTITATALAGSTVTVTSSLTSANSQLATVTLDATRTLIVYSTAPAASTSSGIWAVVATSAYVLGRPTVSVGTPVQLSGGTNIGTNVFVSACSTGTNAVAVGWLEQVSTTSTTPKVVALTVSGNTITAGTPLALHAAFSGVIATTGVSAMVMLGHTTNAFCAAYYDGATKNIYTSVCTISGTTVTQGGEYVVKLTNPALAGYAPYLNGTVHSATQVAFSFVNDVGNTNAGYMVPATITGNAMSIGTGATVGTAGSGINSMASLSSTAGVVLNNTNIYAYTIASNVVTVGTGVACSSKAVGVVSASQVFTYGGSTTGYNWTISGTTVTAGSPATFTSNTVSPQGQANGVLSGTAMLFTQDVIDVATVTNRGSLGTSATYSQPLTGNSKYTLQPYISGGTSLLVSAYLPAVSLT